MRGVCENAHVTLLDFLFAAFTFLFAAITFQLFAAFFFYFQSSFFCLQHVFYVQRSLYFFCSDSFFICCVSFSLQRVPCGPSNILLFLVIAENCSKIGCAITANSQGTSTWFSARATGTSLTGKTFFWFALFISFFRSSGVVRNYQAKLIRDFHPWGVVQKRTRYPMNGFILHVNNYLENQFPTTKTPSIDKQLNTGMVPTCDWMIKIVKVNNF